MLWQRAKAGPTAALARGTEADRKKVSKSHDNFMLH